MRCAEIQKRGLGGVEMSKIAYIEPNRCDRSPFCPAVRSCPAGAIKKIPGKGIMAFLGRGYEIDKEKCTGCMVCVNNCPMSAINMVKA